MISVPVRATENIDVVKPLQEYLNSNYSKAEIKAVGDAIHKFQKLRNEVHEAISSSSSDFKVRMDVIIRYHHELARVSARFPFGFYKSPGMLASILSNSQVPNVKVKWRWWEALRSEVRNESFALDLEQLSVVWNLGAIYSRVGIKAKNEKNDTPGAAAKDASKYFSLSAGCYDHILKNSKVTDSLDLSAVANKLMLSLMLAQSQACMVEFAIETSKSPSVISKLAVGAAMLYKDAHDAASTDSFRRQLYASQYPWEAHCLFQYYSWMASGYYWAAKDQLTESKHGEEIQHLHHALKHCEEASRHENSLNSHVTSRKQVLVDAVRQRLGQANKENETIYFAIVPKGAPPEIAPHFLAKATPMELKDELGVDAFSSLIPPKVREDAAALQTKTNTAVTELSRDAREATDTMQSQLNSMGLPGALVAASDSKDNLPEEVWEKVKEVQHKGGYGALDRDLGRLMAAAAESIARLADVKDALQREKEDDKAMRDQFHHKWTRTVSEQLTAGFQRDIDTVEDFIRKASASNQKIQDEMTERAPLILKLSANREELEATLPKKNASAQRSPEMEALSTLVQKLDAVGAERKRILESLKNHNGEVSYVQLVLTKSLAQATAEESALVEKAKQQLQELLKQQSDLMTQVIDANKAFIDSRAKNDVEAKRQYMIQEMMLGAQSANKLYGYLAEGLKFYADLSREKLSPLKQRAEDFQAARTMEKKMLLEQLTKEFAGVSVDSKQAAPPGAPAPVGQPPAAGAPYAFTQPPPFNPSLYAHPGYQYPPSVPPTATPPPGVTVAHPVAPQAGAAPAAPATPSAPSAPAAPANLAAGLWSCPACTYTNAPLHLQCGMCGTTRS